MREEGRGGRGGSGKVIGGDGVGNEKTVGVEGRGWDEVVGMAGRRGIW